MEVFALAHVAVDYEDNGPAPQLREFDVQVSKGITVGLAGSALAVATVVSPPDAQAMLRLGDQCSAVYDLQNELAFNGFLPTSARDGDFGSQTRTAVLSYQRFEGLAADGVVGPQTLSRLGLSSGLSCGTSGGGTGGGSAGDGTATVTASTLNVRSGPSMTSSVIGSLPRGTSVETRGYENGWTSILSTSPGAEGWVSSQYLSTSGSTGGGTGGGSTTYRISTPSGGGVNVRSSANGTIVGSLADGASVSVTDVRETVGGIQWAQLTNGNWVADTYLTSSSGGSTGGGSSSTTGVINASSGVNVRSSPNGPIVGSLPNGATVSFTTERVTEGGYTWAELTSGNWVATNFIR